MRVVIVLSLLLYCTVSPVLAASAYDEVPSDHWAYAAMDYLARTGFLEGFPEDCFSAVPLRTRYEFAQGIARAMDSWTADEYPSHVAWMLDDLGREFSDTLMYPFCMSNWTVPLPDKPNDSTLKEEVPGDHWSYDALDYFCRAGVLKGYPLGSFSGNSTRTRYQLGMAMARALDSLDGTESEEVKLLARALMDEYKDYIQATTNIIEQPTD